MKQLNFPRVMQTYEYDCGAKALQAILLYYGIEVREEALIKYAKTNEKEGTLINNLLSVFKKYGLKTDSRNITIKELKRYIDRKIPVMLLLQAWGYQKTDYTDNYQDGHWAVAIGHNKDKIFFEDPYSFSYVYLSYKELKDRWHAQEKGKKIINHGIAVYGKKPSYNPKRIIHMD
ncbi:MAG: cysteine peptidase family C39 domain-containing protein [Candidatus Buchananbacteria bacterium]